LSASSRICSPVITWLRWLVSVSMSGDEPVTTTFSDSWADRQLHVDTQPGADLHLDVVGERDREAGFFSRDEIDPP
jgi:hypothetical protein